MSYVSTIPVNVEMEIVLPGNMTVIESHDLALALQHKIESLEDIERAFVHVRSLYHPVFVIVGLINTLHFRLIINVVMVWNTKLNVNLLNHRTQ